MNMSRARNVVQNVTIGPHNSTEDLTKAEYIDMEHIPRVNHVNNAYEGYVNTTMWRHHHYEDPSAMSHQEFLSNSSRRKRDNDLYEPAGPLHSRKLFLGSLDKPPSHELDENGKDPCLSRLILFLILIVSITALVLVVLLIRGFIKPVCSCTGQGKKQLSTGSRSVVSLEPVADEIERVKANISSLQVLLAQQTTKTQQVQRKLESVTEYLKSTTNHTNTPGDNMKGLETQMNSTNTRIEIEVARRIVMEEKANETSRKLDEVVVDMKKFDTSLKKRIDQINKTSHELRTADQDLHHSIMELNRTLIDKVENVSKMIGPTGPRGYNGTHGPRGVPGFNGTKGPQGIMGFNGSRGLPGPPGIQGRTGAGNLSQCEFKNIESPPSTPGHYAANSIYVAEPKGKRIIGVYCYTDRAALVKMDYRETGGIRKYSCSCYGDSSYTLLSSRMKCFISYWQCPRNT